MHEQSQNNLEYVMYILYNTVLQNFRNKIRKLISWEPTRDPLSLTDALG